MERNLPLLISRRALLQRSGCGFGLLGLRALLADSLMAKSQSQAVNPLAPKQSHFPAVAKRVIFLFMHGGPSHVDTFDPKTRLIQDNGQPLPFKRLLTFAETKVGSLMRSPWEFRHYGQSGIEVSDLFPNVGSCADDLCVIRSVVGDGVDHGGALLQLHTGSIIFQRPSLGSWILYGLGTENQNLPGFVTIKPNREGHGGQSNWSNSFLPGAYQGTPIGSVNAKVDELKMEPIEYLRNKRFSSEQQRYELEMLQKINRGYASERQHDPQLGQNSDLRVGVSHANRGSRSFRGRKGIGSHQETLRFGQGTDTRFWLAMPPGQAFGRARGSLRSVLAQLQVGPAQRTCPASYQKRSRGRCSHCWVAPGSEGQRITQGHIGCLGWGVWTHAMGSRRGRSRP